MLVVDHAGHEPLVALTDRQIRTRWEAVREEIKRADVRWKDLRGIFATYYLQAGGDVRQLQYVLGHASMAMTMLYLRRVPPGRHESLRIAARSVGRLEPNQMFTISQDEILVYQGVYQAPNGPPIREDRRAVSCCPT